MKTKVLFHIRLDVEVESTRKVKVKAHTRVVNGKTVSSDVVPAFFVPPISLNFVRKSCFFQIGGVNLLAIIH